MPEVRDFRRRGAALMLFCSGLLIATPDGACRADDVPTEASTDSAAIESSISLERALELALEHNATIRSAKEEVARRNGARVEALSLLFADVKLAGLFQATDQDLIETFGDRAFSSDRNWNARVEVEQPIYRGGAGTAYYSQRKLQQKAALYALEEVIQNVFLSVREQFFAALLAQADFEVQTQSVKLLEEELQSEREKLKAGTVSQFNVLRAEVSVANAKTPLIRARNNVQLTKEELRRILGVDEESRHVAAGNCDIVGDLEFQPVPITLDDALETARSSRPDITRLQLLVDAAQAGVRVKRADYLPSIVARGSYGVEKSRFSDQLDDTIKGWRAEVEATWPIFDSFGREARIDQALADATDARVLFRQALLDVDVEVRRAYSSMLESDALVKASAKVVEQAEESLRLAQSRADAGAGTQLDVLDAQVALTEARSNKVRSLHDYNRSQALLTRAIGRRSLQQ